MAPSGDITHALSLTLSPHPTTDYEVQFAIPSVFDFNTHIYIYMGSQWMSNVKNDLLAGSQNKHRNCQHCTWTVRDYLFQSPLLLQSRSYGLFNKSTLCPYMEIPDSIEMAIPMHRLVHTVLFQQEDFSLTEFKMTCTHFFVFACST